MELDKVRLRTYHQVWSQERTIYQVERVRLPFPITFGQAGTFGGVLLVMMVLNGFPGVDRVPPFFRFVLLPGIITWFLTSQRLDGKSPLRWLLSMLRFIVSPKRMNRLRPVSRMPGSLRFRTVVIDRLKG